MSKKQLCLTLKPKVFLEPRSKRSPNTSPLELENQVLKDIKPKKRGPKPKNNKNQNVKTDKSEKKEEKPRCMARIANGEQCRRSQNPKTESDFCSCHEKHCPHGRIDGPLEGKFLNVPKKRGPKFKNTKDYTLDELDTDLYVQSQLIKVDNELFLLDTLGLLYTNDNKGEIVGRRVKDEIHWYR